MKLSSKRRGFTLIELLVVIAIIAILAAILFPVFAQAREQARKISCLSNIKQIDLSIMMYSQDYDESYPGWAEQSPGLFTTPEWQAGYGWDSMWFYLYPYTKNYQIYSCPDGQQTAQWQTQVPAGNSTYPQFYVHYGYSEYLYNSNSGFDKESALAANYGVAEIAIIADSNFSGIFNDWDSTYSGNARYPLNYLARVALASSTGGSNIGVPRHAGSNFGYADGHAKFLQVLKIQCPASNGVSGEYPIVNPNAASEIQ